MVSAQKRLLGISFWLSARTAAGPVNPGSVSFFERHDNFTPGDSLDDFWIPRDVIISPVTDTFHQFGASIDFNDEIMVVGAREISSAFVYAWTGDEWELQEALAGSGDDWFGAAIAISGEKILVGAPNDDELGEDAGAVHIYEFVGGDWQLVETIHSFTPAAGGRFGSKVVRGEAWAAIVDAQAVEVYRNDGTLLTHDTTIERPVGSIGPRFVDDIDMDGNRIAISDFSYQSQSPRRQGTVYVHDFDGTAWNLTQRLVHPTSPSYRFGTGVAVDGDLIAVEVEFDQEVQTFRFDGNQWNPAGFFNRASSVGGIPPVEVDGEVLLFGSTQSSSTPSVVYALAHNGDFWERIETLTSLRLNELRLSNHQVGRSLALDGDTLVVGAPGTRVGGFLSSGAVYVYDRDDKGTPLDLTDDSWEPGTFLFGQRNVFTGAIEAGFGASTAILGDRLAVGIPSYSDNNGNKGLVRIFERIDTAWRPKWDIPAPQISSRGNFGIDVALGENVLAITGESDATGSDQTVVYVFEFLNGDWQFVSQFDFGPYQLDGSLVIDSGLIYVGMPTETGTNGGSGNVIVLKKEGDDWIIDQRLAPIDPDWQYYLFGSAISVEGEWLVSAVDTFPFSHGAAVVYRMVDDQWMQFGVIDPPDVRTVDNHVSISGNRILLGDWLADGAAGKVYVYEFNGESWLLADILYPEGASNDHFGDAVLAAGNELFVTAPFNDDVGSNAGKVERFVVDTEGVVCIHTFANHSTHDEFTPLADDADDQAIQFQHVPLRPGQTATARHISGAIQGINGLMIDIEGVPDNTLIAADSFTFRTGRTDDTSTWTDLAIAPTVTVRPGEGMRGSDRVTLIWPDRTITNTWLEVTVKASGVTGLAEDEVYYFGNQVGDTNGDGLTDATDFAGIRSNPRNFRRPTSVIDPRDLNRDGRVNAIDLAIVRDHATGIDDGLPLITPTASPNANKRNSAADIKELGSTAKSSAIEDPSTTEESVAIENPLEESLLDDALLQEYIPSGVAPSNFSNALIIDTSEPLVEAELDDYFAGLE